MTNITLFLIVILVIIITLCIMLVHLLLVLFQHNLVSYYLRSFWHAVMYLILIGYTGKQYCAKCGAFFFWSELNKIKKSEEYGLSPSFPWRENWGDNEVDHKK